MAQAIRQLNSGRLRENIIYYWRDGYEPTLFINRLATIIDIC